MILCICFHSLPFGLLCEQRRFLLFPVENLYPVAQWCPFFPFFGVRVPLSTKPAKNSDADSSFPMATHPRLRRRHGAIRKGDFLELGPEQAQALVPFEAGAELIGDLGSEA